MSEERIRILKMLEEGKIEVEEAENLLKSLENKEEKVKSTPKVKKVKITVEEAGEEKVNISLPIGLAHSLLKFLPESAHESLKENDIDISQLIDAVESMEGPSTLVDINDDGDHVKISLE